MKPDSKWADAVRVARRTSLDAEIRNPSAKGRATAFEFAGNARPWVGKASLAPGGPLPSPLSHLPFDGAPPGRIYRAPTLRATS